MAAAAAPAATAADAAGYADLIRSCTQPTVPVSPAAVSAIRRVQPPSWFSPAKPRNGSSGRNGPANGARYVEGPSDEELAKKGFLSELEQGKARGS